jgi:multimeric flavodoxin WrbA
MNTLILDGSDAGDATAPALRAALQAQLDSRGWPSETFLLRDQTIGNCAGDFFCWVRSPGRCNVNDDNRVIAAKAAGADLVIHLSPIAFGGYAYGLKRMLDHQIQNLLPFFTHINGEIHHQKRYRKYPDLLAIGWQTAPEPREEAIFRHLVYRNAINMHARTSVCGVLPAPRPGLDLATRLMGWLNDVAARRTSPAPALPAPLETLEADGPVRRAVLLVGSPRTRKSTSGALGGYLMKQLAARGLAVETVQIYTRFNTAARTRAALDLIDAADLVVLAFPLYVDALPAPVVAAMATIAAHRAGRTSGQRLAAIANCGFPEAAHNATALAICAEFARQTGFAWAGELALGAGEGMVHGAPLEELGGRAISIMQALDLAADALAAGGAIPQAARDLLARPIIASWLYEWMGALGWFMQARQYGAHLAIRRRPYPLAAGDRP